MKRIARRRRVAPWTPERRLFDRFPRLAPGRHRFMPWDVIS